MAASGGIKPVNTNLFSGIAILAGVLYLLSIVLFFQLHFVTSQYKASVHAVSDYGVGSTAKIFQIYAWLGTAGALALAALFFTSRQPVFSVSVRLCLLLMAFSRVGVSLFKTDLEGSPRTKTGVLHYLFAILTFSFAYTAIANATPVLIANEAAWLGSMASILQFVAMIALAGIVITVFKPLRRYFAIVERLFLLSTLLWFLLASCSFIW
jgi:hypothetical protein